MLANEVCSSFENFLLFGANVKESGTVVKRYYDKLMGDVKVLEGEVFKVEVDEEEHLVEFKLKLLPNDMKMLATLAGELTNSATYFTSFANVNVKGAMDVKRVF